MKIAIIWATDNKEKYWYKIFQKFNLKDNKIYLLSQRLESIDWIKTYKEISQIKDFIDLYIFVVNPKISLEILKNNLDLLNKSKLWFQPWTFDKDVVNLLENNCLVYENESCILLS